jgi:hypothetical protein
MPALLERQAAASQATMEQADFAMEAEGLNRPVDVPKGALGAHTPCPSGFSLENYGDYTLVLKDSVQLLRVLQTQSNGHRHIETSMSTTLGQTTWLYKFDGQKYELVRKTTVAP